MIYAIGAKGRKKGFGTDVFFSFLQFVSELAEKKAFPQIHGNAFVVFRKENLSKSRFGLLDDRVERNGVVDGELAEVLAVDNDIRLLQPRDEAAVSDAERTAGGIDANDPKLTEFGFTIPAVFIRIAISAVDGVFCMAEATGFQPEVAFGLLQNAFATRAGCGSICNS